MVSQTREDYLRAFYVLEERTGQIRSTEAADYLQVSKPTVSEMVKLLAQEGLITAEPYAPLRFTAKGRKLAQKLTSKHRIIELFLQDTLKIHHRNIHEEAHRLEHAFSDESVRKLQKLLGHPREDPHGRPIPSFTTTRNG